MGAVAAALPEVASAAPTFPKGAVIRTILSDYAPEDLAGGATLFHEHMSLVADFMPRWIETRPKRARQTACRIRHRPRAAAPRHPWRHRRRQVRTSCKTSIS